MRAHLPDVLRLTPKRCSEPAFRRNRVRQAETRTAARRSSRAGPIRRRSPQRALGAVRQSLPARRRPLHADVRRGAGARSTRRRWPRPGTSTRRFVGGGNAELAIVGDFDAAATRALVTELFGNWKSAVAVRARAGSVPLDDADGADARDARQGQRDADRQDGRADDRQEPRLRGDARRRPDPGRRLAGLAHSRPRPRKGRPVVRGRFGLLRLAVRRQRLGLHLRDLRAGEPRARAQGHRRRRSRAR